MDIISKLKEFVLSNVPEARVVSGGREIVMRCRFCGDSHDRSNKHFYISLDPKKPPLYNCFKCGESGILTSKKLRAISLYDPEVGIGLDNFVSEILKMPNNKIYKSHKINIHNKLVSDTPNSLTKLRYINKRLGLSLTYDDILKNKIILNLYDLLNSNSIDTLTRYQSVCDELHNSFIGFLSMDNSYINMRNLMPGKVSKYVDKKYINYNVYENLDNSRRYYVIPTDVNLNDPNPIKIHIAEGAFDILSVFYNLRKETYNNIYASIGGKAYLNIIKMFIQDFGIINSEFHIYIDSDIEKWELDKIKDYLKLFNFKIYIHYNANEKEKDFGVPLERINEKFYIL